MNGSDQAVERQLVGEVAGPVENALPEALIEREQLDALAHLGEPIGDLEQLAAHLAVGPLRAQARQVDTDPRSHLERRRQQRQQRLDGLGVLGDDRQQIQSGGLAEVEHLRAAALDDLDQPDLFQALDRLADDMTVDRQDLAEVALGGDRRAGRVATADDLGGELLEDLVRKRLLLHRSKGHRPSSLAAGPTSRSESRAGAVSAALDYWR